MTLKELLADGKTPDTTVLSVAGVTTTLGDLRGLSKAEQNAIAKREQELEKSRNELNIAFGQLKEAQSRTAQLFAATEAEKARLEAAAGGAAAHAAPDPFAQYENDAVLGPIVKATKAQFSHLNAQVQEKDNALKAITDGIRKMSESFLTDRLNDTYETMVPEAKRSDIPLDKLIKYGLDNGYKNQAGYVDIRKAYSDLTAGERLAETEKTAEQRGYDKALKEMQDKGIAVLRPGNGGGNGNGTLGDIMPGANREPSQFKNMDEAFAAAANDASLWTNFSNTMQIQ